MPSLTVVLSKTQQFIAQHKTMLVLNEFEERKKSDVSNAMVCSSKTYVINDALGKDVCLLQ